MVEVETKERKKEPISSHNVQQFLIYLRTVRGSSENTVSAYRNDLTQFVDFLALNRSHATEAVGNSRERVMAFIEDMKGREYRATTIARKIAALKSFFSFLVDNGRMFESPTHGLVSPRIGRSLPNPLEETEVDVLLTQLEKSDSLEGKRDRAMLELMYASGMRVSELVSLNIRDIDLRAQYVRCMGKGSKERVIPMYPEAARSVQEYLDEARPQLARSGETEALFLNRRGGRLTRQGFWIILKSLARRAGITTSVTPHRMRHSFATHMLRGGAPLRHVQELLGHASISTTQVYTHLAQDYLRREYDKAHPRARH